MLLEITPNYTLLLNILIILSIVRAICGIICGITGVEKKVRTHFGAVDILAGLISFTIVAIVLIM